ncbi:hypothetical protein PGT21_019067 [Puccinia graminis f. sp. tritici]|uniref:Uncharacterized protein n=1 Tax=Puccinia graminis f. sp. tritici TaxID=56615 RepID=A0A5B0P884_PUCGR|nr:hypothetical protein PGT21_019067 [Puccinia graminis f. sp. tritici]KAA1126015.1 hypothetical protein PGTUg99_011711 [Puccinia graminis f. sp. tritici]
MKASTPWIFLFMLTALLVNGMIERSAKVVAVSWPKQWVLPAFLGPPPGEGDFFTRRATALHIWKDQLIRFYPHQDSNWLVFNDMDCEVLITAHFKNPDGHQSKTDFTLASKVNNHLHIPYTTELIIDVVSVGGV